MVDGPDQESVPNYTAMTRLEGRVCGIFGAGRGIGRQTAHALRQAGAFVICVDSNMQLARAVATEVDGAAVQMDVRLPEQVTSGIQHIMEKHGRLDVVVDIVGASFGRTVLDIDEDILLQNFSLNLFQAMHVTRVAAAAMARSGGGSIVLVGSAAGIVCLPNQAVYGAAKAALHHFVRSAATELGHLGVRVNAVAPGYVRTMRMIERFAPEMWEEIAANTPLQRAGNPSDIAAAASFLASPQSGFVTGQILVADGGLLNAPRVMRSSSAQQISGHRPNHPLA